MKTALVRSIQDPSTVVLPNMWIGGSGTAVTSGFTSQDHWPCKSSGKFHPESRSTSRGVLSAVGVEVERTYEWLYLYDDDDYELRQQSLCSTAKYRTMRALRTSPGDHHSWAFVSWKLYLYGLSGEKQECYNLLNIWFIRPLIAILGSIEIIPVPQSRTLSSVACSDDG